MTKPSQTNLSDVARETLRMLGAKEAPAKHPDSEGTIEGRQKVVDALNDRAPRKATFLDLADQLSRVSNLNNAIMLAVATLPADTTRNRPCELCLVTDEAIDAVRANVEELAAGQFDTAAQS